MVAIQSAAAEIRPGKEEERNKERKNERKKDRNNRAKIQWSALLHRAAIKAPQKADGHRRQHARLVAAYLQSQSQGCSLGQRGEIRNFERTRLPIVDLLGHRVRDDLKLSEAV